MGNDATIKGIGGITYTITKSGGYVEAKKEENGFIRLIGHDAVVNLPKNMASKILVGSDSLFSKSTHDLKIIDGEENDGKSYSDKVKIIDADNITFTAASKSNAGKPTWAKSAKGGDVIDVFEGENNKINAKSGAEIFVGEDAKSTKIEAYQGCNITDAGLFTKVDVKSSPDMKGKNPTSNVSIKSHTISQAKMESGTRLHTSGEVRVTNSKNENIEPMNNNKEHNYTE